MLNWSGTVTVAIVPVITSPDSSTPFASKGRMVTPRMAISSALTTSVWARTVIPVCWPVARSSSGSMTILRDRAAALT